MIDKLKVLVVVFCMISYAEAGTVSIGTVSARGDMRVDSNMVKDSATLFDGSVVETGQATADLHLGEGTEITMASSSRGKLYRDHLVLQQGASELSASSPFRLEAEGISVIPKEPNSHGVVKLGAGNTVEVAALSGSFGVTSENGVVLASVRPGRAASFAVQAGGSTTDFSGVGMVSYENGHYYLTTNADVKYELTCKEFKKFVGTKAVVLAGKVTEGAVPVICVDSIAINGATGMTTGAKLIIAGVIVGGGTAVGFVIHKVTESSKPASN
jgi:hypothetical protein